MKLICSLFSFILINSLFSQTEINLALDNKQVGIDFSLFNIKSIDNSKLNVKYVCIAPCLVKSDDEASMNGVVLSSKGSLITGNIKLSDAVLILFDQDYDIATKTITSSKNYLIALRGVDASKNYKISLEGVENKCRYLGELMSVPYNKTNLSTLPGISSEEIKALQSIFEKVEAAGSGRSVNINDHKHVIKSDEYRQKTVFDLMSGNTYKAVSLKFPVDENVMKLGELEPGVDYLFTRCNKIKTETGRSYKTYFTYNKSDYVKADSVFYADRSSMEKPEIVFNIDKNKYTGMLSRLSCEPFETDKKTDLNYFRYSYIDVDKTAKRVRFQTENGKLNSFIAERTFKSGDTIIHLTRKKNSYSSSVFMKDTIVKRFPLTDKDTLKYNTLYCPNTPEGSNSSFGSSDHIFMNIHFKDIIFLGEQSIVQKYDVGLAQMGQPGSDAPGFGLTKIYVIQNNSVKSINRIRVLYFSDKPSTFAQIFSNDKSCVYLVNMNYPVFFIFDDMGNIKLKSAALKDCSLHLNYTNQKYVVDLNGLTYMVYKESGGKVRLIPFVL